MDSNQDSVRIPLLQDYSIEKDQEQVKEGLTSHSNHSSRKSLVRRVLFTLSAVLIGGFILGKVFGSRPPPRFPHPGPHHHHPLRIFDCQTLGAGNAVNFSFSTHPGKNFFLHRTLSAASIEISRENIDEDHTHRLVNKMESHNDDDDHHHHHGKKSPDGRERSSSGPHHHGPAETTILVEISRSSSKKIIDHGMKELESNQESKNKIFQACSVDAGAGIGLGIFPSKSYEDPKDAEVPEQPQAYKKDLVDVLSEISLKISLPSDLPLLPLTFGMQGPPLHHPHGHRHPHLHPHNEMEGHEEKPCQKSIWFKIKKALKIKGENKIRKISPHHLLHHRHKSQHQEEKVNA